MTCFTIANNEQWFYDSAFAQAALTAFPTFDPFGLPKKSLGSKFMEIYRF